MIERETEQRRRGDGGRVITRSGQFSGFDPRWVLMAKHRSGSLESAVAAVRTRNLIVSSSILLLLTVVIGLIAVSARRAQELARQQMEFVAAVSHELRTPVSVIGAAAGNLADGVVGDPQRVRKYGETIQGEARRLGETVERVLQLAGIAAGHAAAAQTPIAPEDLVHESHQGLPARDRCCRFQRRGRDRRRSAACDRRHAGATVGSAEPDQQRGRVRRRCTMAARQRRCRSSARGPRTHRRAVAAFSRFRQVGDLHRRRPRPRHRSRGSQAYLRAVLSRTRRGLEQIQGSGLGLEPRDADCPRARRPRHRIE